MKFLLLAVLLAPFAAFSQTFNSVRFERNPWYVGIRGEGQRADTIRMGRPDTLAPAYMPKAREKPVEATSPEERTSPSNGFSSPLETLRVTSGYGMRIHPLTRKWAFHAGVDLAARADTVRSVLDGIVARAGYDRHMGHFVSVIHGEYTATYAHLSRYFVLKGEAVRSGQPIGITGSTGASTGEHLHFAVHHRGSPMDPLAFLKKLYLANDFLKTTKTEHDERPEDGID